MFGSTPAATTAQTPGGLFSFNNNASQPQQGGSLFGSTAKPAGGLFGGAAPASTQPAAGGLFGGTSTAASQPAGGLFGQTASTAPAAGGIFGSGQPPNQPAQTAGNLFGASQPAATAQQQRPSLFQPAQSAARPPPLFGASAGAGNTNQQNGNAQQQQQTVPGIKIDASNIKPTTRMFELHEDIQNTIIQIDEIINGGINASMQCAQVLPKLGEAIEQLPLDVAYLESQIEIVEGALGRDAVDVGAARQVVRADASDATVVFGAIENLKLPSQFHYGGGGVSGSGGANLQTTSSSGGDNNASSTDLLAYFNTQSNTLDQRLAIFTKQLLEVELHLRTVEATAVDGIEKLIRRRSVADAGDASANGGADDAGEGIRELVGTMRGFEDAVLRVAGRVGGVREGVVDLGAGLRE
jgi:nucleoporin p58/p45